MVKKLRTYLSENGTRVNFDNVSFCEIESLADKYYNITFQWKYKTSIKEIVVKLKIDTDIILFLEKFNLVPLTPRTFINLPRILYTEEEVIPGAINKARIKFKFEDGLYLIETVEHTQWSWWRDRYM